MMSSQKMFIRKRSASLANNNPCPPPFKKKKIPLAELPSSSPPEDNLDEEWMQYLQSAKSQYCVGTIFHASTASLALEHNAATQQFIDHPPEGGVLPSSPSMPTITLRPPKCTNLMISTKTKVLFLNQPVDIEPVFWNLPLIDYWQPRTGILKKTIKLVCMSPDRVKEIESKLAAIPRYQQEIIRHVDVPTTTRTVRKQPYRRLSSAAMTACKENGGVMVIPARFKSERKVTVGVAKKDIMACRGKKKNVFYNCFALVLRVQYGDGFHEIHAKIFNTGKMEIPGVFNNELLTAARNMVLEVLRPWCGGGGLDYSKDGANEDDHEQNVLINSNFNCGFFIDREKLHRVLRSEKYNLDCSYDPCTYPGVKCKFYYNHTLGSAPGDQSGVIQAEDWGLKMKNILGDKKYTQVSIMIFRTGSSLIGGNCTEKVLRYIFDFIATILYEEYPRICADNHPTSSSIPSIGSALTTTDHPPSIQKSKLRKKYIEKTVDLSTPSAVAAAVTAADYSVSAAPMAPMV